MRTQHSGRTLVMTVGTGDRNRLDDTLYTPLLKSVAEGDWKTVVLLPSQETLLASRFQVGRLLRHCGDPLAKPLLRFEDETLLKPTLRNNSVLVHGFRRPRAGRIRHPLRRLFQDLEKLARDDCGEAVPEVADWLRIARSPAFDAT